MARKAIWRMAAALGLLAAAGPARPETTRGVRQESPGEHPEEPAPPAEPSPAKVGFFRELGRDFAHVVAPHNLVILGAGGAAALLAHPYDRQLTNDFRSSDHLDSFFEAGDVAGGGLVQSGAAVATWLVGEASHSRRIAGIGQDLLRAQVVNACLTQSIKLATNRDRPDGTRWSFPSGHTSAAFTTATVLERRLGWRVGLPAYAAAGYIGASRLQENKHFASDVLFGAAVGIVSGRCATFDRGRYRVTLSSLAVPGGIGLALVGVGR